MELLKNENIDRGKWKRLIASNEFASPFQTAEYFDFFNSVYPMSANVYAVTKNKQICALCVVTFQKEKGIRGYFSRRAIIYGGPLIIEAGTDALEDLLRGISNDLNGKAIYIETRNLKDYSKFKNSFSKCGWEYQPYLNIHLTLRNKKYEEILSKMKYNRRREINLSVKEGVEYREAVSINEVSDVYKILADLYKERVKVPLPELNYFVKLFESSIGKVFAVYHNNRIIAGSFCFFTRCESINTIYYCGLRHYHKKIFPTHLTVLAAIEFGIKYDLKYLDLMGAGLKSQKYGVRDYKTAFGGELVEHGRFLKVIQPFLFKTGRAGLRVLKTMKG